MYSEVPPVAFAVVLGLLGLVFGSFANVVIWRFPRGESLNSPASHCPKCDSPVRWYDNVPVLSWALLRGKCRDCSAPISARYPAVEATSGLLALGAALAYGPSLRAVFAAVFFYLLLILSFIDLDTMRLPNPIVALTAGIGLAGAVAAQLLAVPVVPLVDLGGWLSAPLAGAVVGALVSAGVALAIALAYAAVRRASGFGMGDVKLLGAIGIFLGPYGLMTLFVGSFAGAVAGIVIGLRAGSMKAKYPFGPFLAAAAVVVALVGPQIWGWYLGLAGF